MDAIEQGLLFIHRFLQVHTEQTSVLTPQLAEFQKKWLFEPLTQKKDYLGNIIRQMKDRDIYHLTDPLSICLSLVRIGDALCVIGPYTCASLSAAELKRGFEETHMDEKYIEAFRSYVQRLPVQIMDNLYFATHTLMQSIVGQNSKALVYHVKMNKSQSQLLRAEAAGQPVSRHPTPLYTNVVSTNENLSLLHRLEVTLSEQMINTQVDSCMGTLKQIENQQRHNFLDPEDVESAKIYSAVLCSQMRQTVIQAGILVMLADLRARYYYALIRNASTTQELFSLRRQMLASFCDLIRKEKQNTLSPKIRQVVQLIMADLSGDLSVGTLAAQVNFSPNYLSASFKKELKQSLTDFICDKRMEAAAQFLLYTNMPVRDVSICVGITDFSYFTKLFKKKYGVTPSGYRGR